MTCWLFKNIVAGLNTKIILTPGDFAHVVFLLSDPNVFDNYTKATFPNPTTLEDVSSNTGIDCSLRC